jgi:acetolactate synthase-1/2/3 large subunit
MKKQETEKLTGGEALVRSLIIEGIDTVFGLPGIQLDPMFNALHDAGNTISVINSRHEQGVAYMAFGYAQSTGKVGAYTVVPGPGILNTTAALSTAYACNSRVLAITGQIPSNSIGRGFGMLHEIPDQLKIMQGLTKHSERINHPTEAPAKVSEAFRQLRSGRPRPVGLEMPMDMMWHKSEVKLGSKTLGAPPPISDPDLIEKAAKILGTARQPMIFVGGGAYEACEEVKILAETLQAPVVSYQNGRGVLDERHYLAHTNTAGSMLWADCDAAIAIGCRMQAERMTWGMDSDIQIIQIDIDPTEINRIMKPDVGIVADAAKATEQLINSISKYNVKRLSRKEEMLNLKSRAASLMEQKAGPQMAWLRAIRAALPENGLFVDEFTQVGYVSRVGFPIYHPRSMVTPGYQGTLGYGYATALGVKVANPDKPVVSVNGDGGFMYTMPEIATAVHHGINLVAIVFVDGAYGNVLRMQRDLHDGKVIASQFTNPDFVKLTESFGALGLRAKTPDELKIALDRGFSANRPTVIEVPVNVFPEPFDILRPPTTRGTKG